MHAEATAAAGEWRRRHRQPRRSDESGHHAFEIRAQTRRIDRDALESLRGGVRIEQLTDEGPHRVESPLHPLVRERGSEPEAIEPLHAVIQVVVDLFGRLRRDRRQRRIGRGRECAVERIEVDRGDELTGDGVGEVAVRTLEQLPIAEFRLVAEVGEFVLGLAPRRARVGEQAASVTEEVEADVAERDVLLELRRVGDPLAEALREDQCVVAEAERVGRHRLGRDRTGFGDGLGRDRGRLDVRGLHRWGTESDSV